MTFESLQVGDTIKNKKPFEGEGEYIVADLKPPLFEGSHIKVIQACCTKYPGLNGHASLLDIDALEFYEKID